MEFRFVFCVGFLFGFVAAQIDDDTRKQVDTLFTSPRTNEDDDDFIPGFEPVDSSTQGSKGAIERCGQGKDQGVHICVPYHKCDGRTKTVLEDGRTDGFGIINIRFREDAPCDNYLDVCCKLPSGGVKPNNPPEVDPVDPFDPLPPPATDEPSGPHPGPLPVTPKPIPTYCGIRNENGIDFKISGNNDNEAEYGEFPWMVGILDKYYNPSGNKPLLLCGGSLITPNIVLTAAHCTKDWQANSIKVRAGEWDTQTTGERLPYQERNVVQIIMHESFKTGIVINDVALLVLDRDVKRAEHVGTLCLPTQGERIDSKECYVSGWGKDFFGKQGRYQSILKKIKLPIVSKRQCQQALRGTRLGKDFVLHESFMCAGGEEAKDACTGDGGSPLVCPDPHNPRRYVQAGIVSWGIGCGAKNIPGVYADVTLYRNWIDSQMERLNVDTSSYNV